MDVAAKAITNADFTKFITSGAKFSAASPGYPISYTVRFLRNNRLLKLGDNTAYSVVDCSRKRRLVRVDFNRLHIVKDCERGKGDFFYEFLVNDELVASRPRSNTVECGDNCDISLGEYRDLQLYEKDSESFTVSGWVKESDGGVNGSDEDLGQFRHAYSFKANHWDLGAHVQLFRKSDGCRAELYYETGPPAKVLEVESSGTLPDLLED